MKNSILIVDDEKSIRSALRMIFEYEGFDAEEAETGSIALDLLRVKRFDAVILDIKMPGLDGLETLDAMHQFAPALPIIMLTGHGTIETAVEATRKGAFDFLTKPPDREKILIAVRNAITQNALLRENAAMRKQIEIEEEIIGASQPIKELHAMIHRVAGTDARVLITGENGTGKELVARAIHRRGLRSAKSFIEVNCAAIPTELIESELFGHEKGSFTGATAQRIGKFEQANDGTIFLDEIGDMSAQTQAKVLRVLEEGTFERVGGTKQISVDVRVISATNKNLPEMIKQGEFRHDLYHRLNVIPIHVLPLRDRRDDIPLLVAHFTSMIAQRNPALRKEWSGDAIQQLRSMSWPGNVRELRNAIERLMIMTVSGTVQSRDVTAFLASSGDAFDDVLSLDVSFQEFKDHAEKIFIKKQLERFQWNVSRTAEMLDIQRSHLYTKMRRYGLVRDGEEKEGSEEIS